MLITETFSKQETEDNILLKEFAEWGLNEGRNRFKLTGSSIIYTEYNSLRPSKEYLEYLRNIYNFKPNDIDLFAPLSAIPKRFLSILTDPKYKSNVVNAELEYVNSHDYLWSIKTRLNLSLYQNISTTGSFTIINFLILKTPEDFEIFEMTTDMFTKKVQRYLTKKEEINYDPLNKQYRLGYFSAIRDMLK